MEWVIWVINPDPSIQNIQMFKLNPFAAMRRDFFMEDFGVPGLSEQTNNADLYLV